MVNRGAQVEQDETGSEKAYPDDVPGSLRSGFGHHYNESPDTEKDTESVADGVGQFLLGAFAGAQRGEERFIFGFH